MGAHQNPSQHPHHQPQRHPQRDQTGTLRDPYVEQKKAPGIEVCQVCALLHHAGRWYEGTPPLEDVELTICPACRRVRDRAPAGTVRLRGFSPGHFEEIRGIARNVESKERAEHPLERLMEMVETNGEMRVTTTGAHLARGIGEALRRRFRGEVSLRYLGEAGELQVEAQHRS
ncbi:MAG: ATPase [Planctomycetes bacterium]|nr:ATPase [Planctomycetota bacterium]